MPPTVFDPQTQQPVNVSPEEASAGIVAGKYALDADAGPVPLKGADGSIYRAAPHQVAAALATGKYGLLSPEEELQHQVAKEEAAKGTSGSLAAAGSSALNQAFLGLPSYLDEKNETPEQKAHREAVEAYHSTARVLGGAAGVGASMLIGAPLFKGAELAGQAVEHGIVPAAAAAEASLGARLTAKAANFATQGALMSSPQALIDAAAGDPKKAAETLMWGIGAGGALGGAGELLSSGAGAIGEAIGNKLKDPKTAEWLDNWANERTLKVFGAERSQLNKLSTERMADLANFAHDEGLLVPGKSRQDIGDLVEAAHAKWGQEIGNSIDALDGALGIAKRTGSEVAESAPVKRTPEEIATYLRENPEAAAKMASTGTLPDEATYVSGKSPAGFTTKHTDALDAALTPGKLGDAIKTALDGPEMRMPMNADQAKALELVVDSANALPTVKVNGQEVVPFADAQKFVSDLRKKWVGAIGKSANDGGVKGLETVTALDRMKEAAYQVARDAVHASADKVAAASEQPALVGALAKAKGNYAKLAQLEQFAATLERQRAGNRMVGLTDMIHMGQGPGTAVTSGLGAALGGAVAGPAGAMVGSQVGRVPGIALDFIAKKWMEDKGLVAISALAKRAAKEGPDAFAAIMASEGAKRLSATMNGVGDTIRRMAIRGTSTTTASADSDHMSHLLGSTQGLSADQAYKKLGSRLTSLAANPEALTAATAAASAPFAAASPQLGAAYQAQLHQTLSYLQNALPKPPGPPLPFAPNDWQPSKADKLAFHDKAEIVSNPMRAMHHVQRGTLSDAHLDALQTVYPKVLGQMRDEVLKFAADHPEVKLPARERQSVSKLLGQPLDTISQHLPALQASYAPKATQGGGQPPGQRAPKGKIKNMPSAASAFTGSLGPSSTGA